MQGVQILVNSFLTDGRQLQQNRTWTQSLESGTHVRRCVPQLCLDKVFAKLVESVLNAWRKDRQGLNCPDFYKLDVMFTVVTILPKTLIQG